MLPSWPCNLATKPPISIELTKPGCNAKADRHICLVSVVFRVENSAADGGTKVSNKNLQLVGGWSNPSEKYMLVKLEIFPK